MNIEISINVSSDQSVTIAAPTVKVTDGKEFLEIIEKRLNDRLARL